MSDNVHLLCSAPWDYSPFAEECLMRLNKSSIGEHSATVNGRSSSSIVRISGSQIKMLAFSAFIAVPIPFL